MKHTLYKWLSILLFTAVLTASSSAFAHHCWGGGFSFGFGPAFYPPVYYYQPYYPVSYQPVYYYPAYYSPYHTECVTVLGHYNRHGRWVPTHRECYDYFN